MFLCKFFLENNSSNYVFEDNNQLFGFSIDKNGIDELQYEVLNTIKKNLFMNSRCQKVLEHNGYDVYFDYFTGYKHFIKDGKENIELFFENNGKSAILHDDESIEVDESNIIDVSDEKNSKNNSLKSKIFRLGTITLITTLLGSNILSSLKPSILKISDYIHYNNGYKIEQIVPIDEEQGLSMAIDYINDSQNLSDEDKALIVNSELLEFILPYYGDNLNEKLLICLNDLTVKYIPVLEDEEFLSDDEVVVLGYYNTLSPNTINVAVEDDTIDKISDPRVNFAADIIKIHELIHLFSSNFKYPFLTEGVATILSQEINYSTIQYLGNGYTDDLHLLKLLMEVIGTEPILKSLFGGDSKMLESILAQNLSYSDYNSFLELLNKEPGSLLEEEKNDMYNLIGTIYKNINGCDMEENSDLMIGYLYEKYLNSYDFKNSSFRRYFLTSDLLEFKSWFRLEQNNKLRMELLEKGFIQESLKWVVDKELSYEEYLNADDLEKYYIVDDLGNKLDDLDDIVIKKLTPELESGKYVFHNQKLINPGETIDDGYTFVEEKVVIESLVPNVSVFDSDVVEYRLLNSLDRFPNFDNDKTDVKAM